MNKIFIFGLCILLLVNIASAKELRCDYGNGIIKTVDLYQCPPVLKEFHRLESQTENTPPATPVGGGGGGGSGFFITPEEALPNTLNTSCINRCDECYAEGSEIWYDCMYASMQKNLDNIEVSKRNFMIYTVIFIFALIIFIIGLIKQHDKKHKPR